MWSPSSTSVKTPRTAMATGRDPRDGGEGGGSLQIANLAEYVLHLPRLAEWQHAEFGYLNPSNTVQRYVERLSACLLGIDLPKTFIALRGDTLLGSASLVRQTITHHHLSPWLSSVYVDPKYRGSGIASALVSEVEKAAAEIGSERIYLFTPTARNCTRVWAGK